MLTDTDVVELKSAFDLSKILADLTCVLGGKPLLVTYDGPNLVSFWLHLQYSDGKMLVTGLNLNQLGGPGDAFRDAQRILFCSPVPLSKRACQDLLVAVEVFADSCGLEVHSR